MIGCMFASASLTQLLMKRILVPCDFSKPAVDAFRFAVSMAKTIHARVEVLFVVDFKFMTDPISGGEPILMEPHFYTAVEKQSRTRFAKMVNEHAQDFEAVTFKIETGSLLGVITNEINVLMPECVVMGTHGTSGIRELFVGSNTEKVVRFASCPVFSIHNFVEFSSIRSIVHPTELKLNQTDFIIHLKSLQRLTNAKLHILYINTPDRSVSEEDLKDYTDHYKLSGFTVSIRDGFNESDEIIRFAEERNADLVAMATHSRHGLSHLFSGSVSEDVVNHIQTPVWTYSLNLS